MTDEEARALGLRALACVGWRWMDRMVHMQDSYANTVHRVCGDGRLVIINETDDVLCIIPACDDWPDFRDPATKGCLLALVREAHSNATISVRYTAPEPPWSAHPEGGYWHCNAGTTGPTEGGALVAALEAAP